MLRRALPSLPAARKHPPESPLLAGFLLKFLHWVVLAPSPGWRAVLPVHQQSGYTAETALDAAQTTKSVPVPEGLQSFQRRQGRMIVPLEILDRGTNTHSLQQAQLYGSFENHLFLLSAQAFILLPVWAELLLTLISVFPQVRAADLA